jgi:Tol biopolymer transport system component
MAPAAPLGVVDRQLKISEAFRGTGGLSSDGTLMAFRTADGGVGVLDTQSLHERILVPGEATGEPIDGTFIRGSEQAVLWAAENSTCKCLELRQVALAGGAPRVVSRTRFNDLELIDLTRDGDLLLARTPAAGDPAELVLIHVTTGKDRVVLKPPESAQFPRLSPDGKFIVYSAASQASDVGGDVFVADTATGNTWPLLSGRADDRTPLWTDDGSVLFASNRAGGYGLWRQEVVDGQARGEPVLIERDMGRFIPLYVAGDRLTYWRSPVFDIELATFDPQAGEVTGPTRMLPARVSGASTAPSWSSDGKTIAYASERRPLGPARSVIVLHSTTASSERELTVPVNGLLEPVWSPDANRLLIRGPGTFDGVRGGRIVEISSGQVISTLPYPIGGSHQWSRDGRSIYFLDPQKKIQRVELATGRKMPIAVEGGWVPWSIALSRDGRVIAASAARTDRTAIILVPVDGGSPSVVYEPGDKSLIPTVWDWTPDDRRLLAVLKTPNQNEGLRQLVTISVDDGRLTDSGLMREALDWVRVRPDGRELAYRIGRNVRTLWQRSGLLRPR